MRLRPLLLFLLSCALFSLVVVQPFVPDHRAPGFFRVELRAQAQQAAVVQVYWDDGAGMAEAKSVRRSIAPGATSQLVFPLPLGALTALRLDPLDRPGQLTIAEARIATRAGRTVRVLPLEQLSPVSQIASTAIADGQLTITTTAEANDPILVVANFEPVNLAAQTGSRVRESLRRAVPVFLILAALGSVVFVAPLRRFGLQARAALARPIDGRLGVAIAGLAAVATLASSYPIVFLGKSLVSPNLGTPLLYPGMPTLPRLQSADAAETSGADVGALLWQHVPYAAFQAQALAEGELPLWNRYNSAGVPMLGQGQSSFGDPLNLLPMLAGSAAWAWDLKFLLAKWLLAFGTGLSVWRLTRHRSSALLMTASAPFIGFFVYRINHPAIFSLCYAPWVLLAWQGAIDSATWRGYRGWCLGWLIANFALLCSGTAKESVIVLGGANAAGLLLLLLTPQPWADRGKRLAGLTLTGIVFLLLSAPHWILFLDTLRQSSTSYDIPRAYQVPPGLFVALFDEIFHRPLHDGGVINPSANFLTLFGLAWVAVRGRAAWADHRSRALLLAAMIPAAFVFGVIPPGWIMAVPGLAGIMHIDNTFSCLLIVLLLPLAGWGWKEAWFRLRTPDGGTEAILVSLLVALALAAYYGTVQAILRTLDVHLAWGIFIRIDPWIHGYAASLFFAGVGFLAVLRLRSRRGFWTPSLLLLGGLCLAVLHWRHGLHGETAVPRYVVSPTERPDFGAPSEAVDLLRHQTHGEPLRVVGLGATLHPGWTGTYGLEGLNGAEALMNPYYRELLLAAGVPQTHNWRYVLDGSTLPALQPLLDSLNVGFVVAPGSDPFVGTAGYALAHRADLNAFRSASVWPRAFFVEEVRVYDDLTTFLSWVREANGHPFAAVHRTGDSTALDAVEHLRAGGPAQAEASPAHDYRLTTNRTAFTIIAPAPGVVVLLETFGEHSFAVTLNGAPAEAFRVNHAFKGLVIPAAGEYRIEFAYRPRFLAAALVMFGSGAVLGAALWWWPRRHTP